MSKQILVFGDWVVDKFYHTIPYRSETSLRTGIFHQKIEPSKAPIVAFCGAGRVASILRGYEETQPIHKIHGYGIWHNNDTHFLMGLFNPIFQRQIEHGCITQPATQDVTGVSLVNLGGEKSTTTQVNRVYSRKRKGISIQSRTDWETNFLIQPDLEILESGTEFKAIVIKDLMKGVVSEYTIEVLAKKYKDVPWFVSTKNWNAPWLEQLKDVNLKLLLIPPVAAKEAVNSGSVFSWLSPKTRKVTKDAAEAIDTLRFNLRPGTEYSDSSEPVFEGPIVVCPHEGAAIAYENKRFASKVSDSNSRYSLVGWASAFFAALVHWSLRGPESGDSKLNSWLDYALDYADSWSRNESNYLNNRMLDLQSLESQQNLPVPLESSNPEEDQYWDTMIGEWREAHKDEGVINGRLELWRSTTLLDGYVCIDRNKLSELSRLLRMFQGPVKEDDLHKAIQVAASPGSGKSYLVKCIAEALDFELCEFNITQLQSKSDLISCFDKIISIQAELDGKQLLVFFDEINAKLNGNPVYDSFLAPLEDGVYFRRLQKTPIQPCFWIFAGTGPNEAADKYDDFENRMLDQRPIAIGKLSETESVYAGVQLIRRSYPDVIRISEEMLKKLKTFDNVRNLKKFVRSLRDVRNGRVTLGNTQDRSVDNSRIIEIVFE